MTEDIQDCFIFGDIVKSFTKTVTEAELNKFAGGSADAKIYGV